MVEYYFISCPCAMLLRQAHAVISVQNARYSCTLPQKTPCFKWVFTIAEYNNHKKKERFAAVLAPCWSGKSAAAPSKTPIFV